MIDIKASDYTRQDLETFIKTLPSITNYRIVGTEKELTEKNLSYKSKIHGVPCVVLVRGKEVDMRKQPITKVNRGEKHPSKLN